MKASTTNKRVQEERFRKTLRAVGERATPARVALLTTLEQAGRPLSMQTILQQMKAFGTDQVTVYRSLHMLEQKGLIQRVDLRHGHTHFELAASDHHHLVCLTCGNVEDFTGCGVTSMVSRALKQSKHFVEVKQYAVELFGYCKRCYKNK
ncbi:hypothetical protein COV04_01155 [Candidatus Uhrbacteria bacterium CG10_big_fil_rev_8_21_14_0_10_48_11]|uniref:Transcriptional repressor n=1 Tax=Candidatus Uhrbacteria bacterium CG10_big_fil_rev_8_21_14_0_10_48_11 TaxID=1975037 RepID=A0A2M8LF99_9BACT|nr:MAG: hypothetical protein COV04_01155 [Candidatus Uhrbacteria bacterium CG10_big_fil_rev_8_21_14_0_10_48_11]